MINHPNDPANCGQFTSSVPEVMAFWIKDTLKGRAVTDYPVDEPVPGWHVFIIDNPAGDNDYDYYLDGTKLGNTTPDLGFDRGWNIVGTERGHDVDQAGGRWNQIYYQNYSGWHLWNSACLTGCGTGLPQDDDPIYYGVIISNSILRVRDPAGSET